MKSQIIPSQSDAAKTLRTQSLKDFRRIHEVDIEGVILNRTISPSIVSFLENTILDKEGGERFYAPLSEILGRTLKALGDLDVPDGIEKTWLAEE